MIIFRQGDRAVLVEIETGKSLRACQFVSGHFAVAILVVAGENLIGRSGRRFHRCRRHRACRRLRCRAGGDVIVFLQRDAAVPVRIEAIKGLLIGQFVGRDLAVRVFVKALEYAATGRLSGGDGWGPRVL